MDISDRFDGSSHNGTDSTPRTSRANGTDTPRDLNSRIKILELYTLHVLPRNEEWDYAKEFISMSEILDEERREIFLHTLQSLQDQKQEDQDQEHRILQEQEEILARERLEEAESRIAEESLREQEQQRTQPRGKIHHIRTNSEKDYGIDDLSPKAKRSQDLDSSRSSKQVNSNLSHASGRRPASKRPPPTRGVYHRGIAIVSTIQKLVMEMTGTMSKSPVFLLRMVIFLLALIITFSKRDVRERLGRIAGVGWDKLKRTMGMGVKVSYI